MLTQRFICVNIFFAAVMEEHWKRQTRKNKKSCWQSQKDLL